MTQIKLRRDTAANFTSKNPVLGVGEPAYETDTKKLKIGDGTTAYNSLEYFSSGGGGSTNITAVLPLKIVDGVMSLEVDDQTIQIVDGKLHANLDELGNEVNTLAGDVAGVQADLLNKQDKSTAVTINTDQDVTGAKSFTAGLTTFKNTDNIRKVLAEINGNGYYCNYYASRDSGEKPCYLGKVSTNAFNMGIPELTGVTGRIFANTLTKYNGSNEIGTILSTDILDSYVDGTTITWDPTTSKLSATSGSSEPPTNMVTTDTIQTITEGKTFESKIIFNKPDSDTAEQSSILGGEFKLGTPDNDNSIHASKLTLNANTTNTGTFKVQALPTQLTQINGPTITSQRDSIGAFKIVNTIRPSGASSNKNYSVLYSEVDNKYNHKLTINNLSSDLVLAGKTVKDGSGNKFLTSGDVSSYVTEEFVDGTEGYRIWNNGRGEQWGSFVGPKSITFLKNYADTNYILLAYVASKTSQEAYNGVFGVEKQTTGFFASGFAGTTADAHIITTCGTVNWYTSGVLAS